jgi:hypothetical protein
MHLVGKALLQLHLPKASLCHSAVPNALFGPILVNWVAVSVASLQAKVASLQKRFGFQGLGKRLAGPVHSGKAGGGAP